MVNIIWEFYCEGVRQYKNGTIDTNISLYTLIKQEETAEEKSTQEAIIANLLNLIWASHDTTAGASCNVLYYLHQYRNHECIKDSLIPEIDSMDVQNMDSV